MLLLNFIISIISFPPVTLFIVYGVPQKDHLFNRAKMLPSVSCLALEEDEILAETPSKIMFRRGPKNHYFIAIVHIGK